MAVAVTFGHSWASAVFCEGAIFLRLSPFPAATPFPPFPAAT